METSIALAVMPLRLAMAVLRVCEMRDLKGFRKNFNFSMFVVF